MPAIACAMGGALLGDRMKYSVQEAADTFSSDFAETRASANSAFGLGAFDIAFAHWCARKLIADTNTGVVRDREGIKSRFLDYGTMADHYAAQPSHVWHDFFSPVLMNSCSRLHRGLKP